MQAYLWCSAVVMLIIFLSAGYALLRAAVDDEPPFIIRFLMLITASGFGMLIWFAVLMYRAHA